MVILNPLVMMGVLTFVFTKIFVSTTPNFPVFLLCGMVPFNFFSVAWITGTTSLVDNVGLISAVLWNCLHLVAQIAIVVAIIAIRDYRPNRYWALLPVSGCWELYWLAASRGGNSAVNVFVRDTRYIVKSSDLVLW